MKAAQRKGSNIAKMRVNFVIIWRALQGHSGGIPIERTDELRAYPLQVEKVRLFHGGFSWNFLSIWVNGLIPGGREKDKARQAVFLTSKNPCGNDPEEEKPHSDYSVPQKAPHETKWKRNQDAVYWVRLKEAQDQGLEFWQTKSLAIMTYTTIPGDCIDRVTAENGERVIFERLETPRLVPKVMLERNWQASSSSSKNSSRSSKFHTQTYLVSGNREQHGKARQKCKTTRNTIAEADPPGNWGMPLLTWMWILISVVKKTAQMHS